jgi:2-oxoglutarate/2-oxoacid ferredoxin oxidoreductase subunit beta
VNLLYIIENNGVYGLTKGQFSASADVGSKSKKGEANKQQPIDPVMLALTLGAPFVARSFSGDKAQLVPLIKAGLAYRGFALIDVISPCVTFNDHEGSTKSYRNTRERLVEISRTDFVPHRKEITAQYEEGSSTEVEMHDGSVVRLVKTDPTYDPTDRTAVAAYLQEHQSKGEVPTGLLFLNEQAPEMHQLNDTTLTPLAQVPYEKLCPGSALLDKLQNHYR